MKLKDFKKLNENWEKWNQSEPVAEEKKNCGCGQDPCVTYGAQNESAEQVSEGRYHFANSFDQLDIGEDPRAQALEQCIKILNELTYDSLEGDVASYADDAARLLWKAAEELDYKRNQVGNVEESKVGQALKSKFADAFRIGKEKKKDDKKKMVTPEQIKEWWGSLPASEKLKISSKMELPRKIKDWGDQEWTNAASYLLDNPVEEALSPEQEEANEKAYSLCFEMGRKGTDVHTARRKVPAADFKACMAGHQDGANEFMQSLAERVRQTVVNKLQEKAKSKNQQQFMGMVKKCQDTGDCASDEVKKAADSMKKSDVKDFAGTKHKGLPNKVEDKK